MTGREYAPFKDKKLVLNGESEKDVYYKLFDLHVGEVFKIESDYETVLTRISESQKNFSEENGNFFFSVFPINPGTDLYTIYGDSHVIVVENSRALPLRP